MRQEMIQRRVITEISNIMKTVTERNLTIIIIMVQAKNRSQIFILSDLHNTNNNNNNNIFLSSCMQYAWKFQVSRSKDFIRWTNVFFYLTTK